MGGALGNLTVMQAVDQLMAPLLLLCQAELQQAVTWSSLAASGPCRPLATRCMPDATKALV